MDIDNEPSHLFNLKPYRLLGDQDLVVLLSDLNLTCHNL